MSTQWMTDMLKLEQAHIVTNLQNTALVKNAVGKERQTSLPTNRTDYEH